MPQGPLVAAVFPEVLFFVILIYFLYLKQFGELERWTQQFRAAVTLARTWFDSQHPIGDSQASHSVPGSPTLSSDLCRHQTSMWYISTQAKYSDT